MHPVTCPDWDYQDFDNHSKIICEAIEKLLIDIRKYVIIAETSAVDTRPTHKFLFIKLTPKNHRYYAGHYRGEDYKCLKYFEVGVPGDNSVGRPAQYVHANIKLLGQNVIAGLSALDNAYTKPNSVLPHHQKIAYTVVFCCKIFVEFLHIHPYINGNGHIARFLIWILLGRYNIWPKKWPIEPRPPDPPYTQMIREYRTGNKSLLERYVLNCILHDT